MQRKLYTDFDLPFVWGYTVPIFQLQFVGGFAGSSLVHVQMYFYSFSCNVIDVLIKHILAWLTKVIIYASNPSSVLRANLLIFGLELMGSPRS